MDAAALWTPVFDICDLRTRTYPGLGKIAMPETENQDSDRLAHTDGRVCGYCARPIPAGQAVTALIPDSSAMAPQDAIMDGQRLVTACGNKHISALGADGRRAWVEEQRWFGRLCRASVEPGMREATVSELGEQARMSEGQVAAALDWNARGKATRTVLPGGQPLPTGP